MAEINSSEAVFVYDDSHPGILVSTGGLHVGEYVTVMYNGNRVDLRDIIKFPGDGYICRIELNNNNSSDNEEEKNGFDYRVDVVGAGPSTSGRGWIYFTDETSDKYSLSFYAHKQHSDYVRYNSTAPTIHMITWEPIG